MKLSEIYREAAKREARLDPELSEATCCLIDDVVGGLPRSVERVEYHSLFCPNDGDPEGYAWAAEWPENDAPFDDWWRELHDCRVLALCFMAAIAEYEEKHGT